MSGIENSNFLALFLASTQINYGDLIMSLRYDKSRWYGGTVKARCRKELEALLDAFYENIVSLVWSDSKEKHFSASLRGIAGKAVIEDHVLSTALVHKRYACHPASEFISFDPASKTIVIQDIKGFLDAMGVVHGNVKK
ncbi:MAG: hypothetical protein ACKO0Z_27940 [Betaproteobacteria bacterium]